MFPSIHTWTCGQVFSNNAESGHEVEFIRTNSSTLTLCVRMEALSSWSWRSWSSSLIAIIIHHGHPLHQHRIIITTQQSNNSQSTSQSANQSINTSQNQSISPIIIERQATLINIKQHQSIQSISILSWSKSFIRERPFFANKNVSFAKLSRTPCLSFAEPMVGNHDIQLSRNFREKKCYFRKFGKNFREGFQHNMHGFRN